jgi:hypothetical protein
MRQWSSHRRSGIGLELESDRKPGYDLAQRAAIRREARANQLSQNLLASIDRVLFRFFFAFGLIG